MPNKFVALGLGVATLGLLSIAPARADERGPDAPRQTGKHPQVVVISLDGAKPDVIERFLRTGVLDHRGGLGTLARHGVVAEQNVTVTPSVTAVAHIAIATGSTSAHNDIPGNTFHPVGAPIGTSLSGFAAPIGGYEINPLTPAPAPTAEPLWVKLRAAGLKVVTATWPGSDGADIRVAGQLVQAATPIRTNDYTVPFGAFGGLGAQGFERSAAAFGAAPAAITAQIKAAGIVFFGDALATDVETVFCAPAATATCGTTGASGRTLRYDIKAVALDTTNDGQVNYDTLVFYDAAAGIRPGPFTLPSTGAAVVRAGGPSAPFFFEGSGSVVGTGYFATHLAPDLSSVRFLRYGANFIPRNAAALAAVDDINTQVGFWAAQADFRIPERLSPGFDNFPDTELEAAYEDQVRTFVAYQTRVALHAIRMHPDADLVMIYIEQPDGSGHQFTLTDPRQATDPRDARSVGKAGRPAGAIGQDHAKIARYARYLEFAYRQADSAVASVLDAIGTERDGTPRRDVFVVSDHGMAPFHTTVQVGVLLSRAGIDLSQIAIRTTGPAINIYVNLKGREPATTAAQVDPAEFQTLVARIAAALRGAVDPNPFYNPDRTPLFSHVWTRPSDCAKPGFCTDPNIGQDTGDVLALTIEGYNTDGTQSPVVARLGDDAATAAIYSVPNFYGAHGHDSGLKSMSAILYAAGPNLRRHQTLRHVRNIDIAPTVMQLLDVAPAATVDGRVLRGALRHGKD